MSENSSLEEITIRGLGVIDSASIEIKDGLTVLTGETGAGKTMVLTALSLILGAKSDTDLIRNGEERATVSGKFHISSKLSAELIENGAEIEDSSVIISRTISTSGKSRALLGGNLVNNQQIVNLADSLIEIHAQSSTARLAKPQVQRQLLDDFAQNSLLVGKYSDIYSQYLDLSGRIADLKKRMLQRDQEVQEIKQFIDDFRKVNPETGEIDSIEEEIVKLSSVELLHEEITKTLTLLEDEDTSIFNMMQQGRKSLDLTRGKDSVLDEISEKYTDALFTMQEVSASLASYLMNLEADPVRFDFLQNRKSSINSLLKKYGKGSDRAIAYEELVLEGQAAQLRLEDLTGGDTRISDMEQELKVLFEVVTKSAQALSSSRQAAAKEFSHLVSGELTALSMPNAKLEIRVITDPGLNISAFSTSGLDEVGIFFTAHKDGNFLPLAKVASGGEMSRTMLAIEVVLAERAPLGTYIFDEVDAGVGGKAAVEVGRRLAKLAKRSQVIVVTHLAQVAAWADNHLVVQKNETGSVTQSDVMEIAGKDREVEIARMLSGQENSTVAREHAAELLKLVHESMIS